MPYKKMPAREEHAAKTADNQQQRLATLPQQTQSPRKLARGTLLELYYCDGLTNNCVVKITCYATIHSHP